MRFVYPTAALLLFSVVLLVGPDTAHVQVGDDISPKLNVTENLDMDVFVESLNESGLKTSIEGYLDQGWVCKFLSTALDTEYGNGDRLYGGCAAFNNGSSWDAIKWDYTYDVSESQGTPAVPDDILTDTLISNPTGTSGLTPILSDRMSWDYLLYVGDNIPTDLYGALVAKDLTKVWVEHQTGGQEQMRSFWRYEGDGQSQTICVWSNVSSGEFGTINVD